MLRLLDIAGDLLAEREPEVLFERILEAGRELTGARYAALGVLNEQRTGLEHFHAAGIDDDERCAIGGQPRGRGLLGALILDQRPLRIDDLALHPGSYGFPPHHPVMKTFLGVPISLRGQACGNLYLADKDEGSFSEGDEQIAVVLAGWAASTIEAARFETAGGWRSREFAAGEAGLVVSASAAPAGFEDTLVELLDAAPDGILVVGADGLIVFANEALAQLFGYERGELVGEATELLVPVRYHSRHVGERNGYADAPRRRPMGLGMSLQGMRRDGSEFPVEVSLSPLVMNGETLTVSIVRDATEQRLIEEQRLRYARSRAVEEIVSGLDAIVWTAAAPDRDSLTYLGGRREMFLGYPPDQWRKPGFWLSVVHSDDRIAALTFAESALEHDTFELEYRLIDALGAIHQVRDIVSVKRGPGGAITGLSGVIVDMTERRELEARLAHAQKMEAVGQLAGGIAHDFNNLLTIVSGYARRLRARADLGGAQDGLDQIIAAADRAAQLTSQLLAFARRGQSEQAPVDVNRTIQSLEPMLRRLIDADIALELQLGANLPRVLMDSSELEQILMNLIINASDAMVDGGTLSVRTETHLVSASESSGHRVEIGDDVRISISDTGTGIPPEVRERIFEPFFTTKPNKGTGMGLATVYGIVDQAGGWIDLDTAVGVGTTFQVMLPVAVAEQGTGTPENASPKTVLLVEDEPALRKLVGTLLGEHGYTVLEAGNGIDAIGLVERHRGQLDLLLTDIVMPRLAGPELAQRLQSLRPGLPVLFMSGYNDSRLVNRGAGGASVNLLLKPFTPDQLVDRVRVMTAPVNAHSA